MSLGLAAQPPSFLLPVCVCLDLIEALQGNGNGPPWQRWLTDILLVNIYHFWNPEGRNSLDTLCPTGFGDSSPFCKGPGWHRRILETFQDVDPQWRRWSEYCLPLSGSQWALYHLHLRKWSIQCASFQRTNGMFKPFPPSICVRFIRRHTWSLLMLINPQIRSKSIKRSTSDGGIYRGYLRYQVNFEFVSMSHS